MRRPLAVSRHPRPRRPCARRPPRSRREARWASARHFHPRHSQLRHTQLRRPCTKRASSNSSPAVSWCHGAASLTAPPGSPSLGVFRHSQLRHFQQRHSQQRHFQRRHGVRGRRRCARLKSCRDGASAGGGFGARRQSCRSAPGACRACEAASPSAFFCKSNQFFLLCTKIKQNKTQKPQAWLTINRLGLSTPARASAHA